MNSTFTLKIADKTLREKYEIMKLHQTSGMFVFGVLLRFSLLFLEFFNIFYFDHRNFTGVEWIVRSIQVFGLITLLILAYKWQKLFAKLQSAFTIPLMSISFFTLDRQEPDIHQMFGNYVGFLLILMFAFMINNNWILTSTSTAVVGIVLLSYYFIVYEFFYYICIFLIGLFTIVTIYGCYYFEKIQKDQFLHMNQMQTMNKDLAKIFDSLPEGVILFDEETKQLALVNKEFRNLFQIPACSSFIHDVEQSDLNDGLTELCLNQPYLVDYSADNNTNSSTDGETHSILQSVQPQQQMKSILEACNEDQDQKQYAITIVGTPDNVYPQPQSHKTNDEEVRKVVSISKSQILFKNQRHSMIMLRNLTSSIRCQNLQIENHFYEMLTATVSHDLRTPLNAIIGLLNNMDGFVQDERGVLFLNIIRNSSKFMSFLVNDLLDFFQIKNGKFKGNPQQVNIIQSIKDLIEMFKVGAKEKGIEIIFNYDIYVPSKLMIDEQRTRQVLLNLLQNALKFTFKGSINVYMNYDFSSQQIVISVSDTGVGIKLEDQQKLFKMFGKLESTASINTTGIGLGLGICKKIVETLNGSINIDPTFKDGARFIFRIQALNIEMEMQLSDININFDLTEDDQDFLTMSTKYKNIVKKTSQPFHLKNIKIPKQNTPKHLKNKSSCRSVETLLTDQNNIEKFEERDLLDSERQQDSSRSTFDTPILVVDDNIFNQVTIQAILEMQFEIKCQKANNGLEATQLIEQQLKRNKDQDNYQQHFKLILMDCNMPIMDGFQASQKIRKLEKTYGVQPNQSYPIVALTAYQNDIFKEQSKKKGMNDFLNKPVSADQLRDILLKYKVI